MFYSKQEIAKEIAFMILLNFYSVMFVLVIFEQMDKGSSIGLGVGVVAFMLSLIGAYGQLKRVIDYIQTNKRLKEKGENK